MPATVEIGGTCGYLNKAHTRSVQDESSNKDVWTALAEKSANSIVTVVDQVVYDSNIAIVPSLCMVDARNTRVILLSSEPRGREMEAPKGNEPTAGCRN